ncbi:antitoxin VapB family protein [Haladaptatus sp. F3-133]|uniref:Antitoxin VapB family protein n=1 Tax=Halorutilus salinus TaxID=2487751 RepID=A0A9Q4C4V5_9EURY|nr:antitoxin VapB family protein [Halorutilus salinus]MCX2819085.1 antitoxin VapB family protein [Halorutilus salinus]
MGTKTVRLDEDVYERVRSRKRDDETFSEAIDRLTGGSSLLDLEGTLSDEEADEVREAIEESREADVEESKEIGEG